MYVKYPPMLNGESFKLNLHVFLTLRGWVFSRIIYFFCDLNLDILLDIKSIGSQINIYIIKNLNLSTLMIYYDTDNKFNKYIYFVCKEASITRANWKILEWLSRMITEETRTTCHWRAWAGLLVIQPKNYARWGADWGNYDPVRYFRVWCPIC